MLEVEIFFVLFHSIPFLFCYITCLIFTMIHLPRNNFKVLVLSNLSDCFIEVHIIFSLSYLHNRILCILSHQILLSTFTSSSSFLRYGKTPALITQYLKYLSLLIITLQQRDSFIYQFIITLVKNITQRIQHLQYSTKVY